MQNNTPHDPRQQRPESGGSEYVAPPPHALSESEQENDLLRVSKMVWDRKWYVIVLMAIMVGISAMQLKRATNVYVASAQIRYEPSGLHYVDFGEVGRQSNYQDEILTQIEVIRGPVVTAAVLEALGLDRQPSSNEASEDGGSQQGGDSTNLTLIDQLYGTADSTAKWIRNSLIPVSAPPVSSEEAERQNRINWMRSKVQVFRHGDTKLINIHVRDHNPQMAARIANEYAEQYRRNLTENKMDSYRTVREFFDTQIAQARLDLARAQQELLEFSEASQTDIKLLETESEITLSVARSLRNEIESRRNELVLREAELSSSQLEEVDVHLLSLDPEYKRMTSRINELQLDRISLLAENTPENPRVVRVDRQIESLTSQLEDHLDAFRLSRAGSVMLLRENIDRLQERLRSQEARFNRLQNDMIAYRQLQMDVRTQEELLDQLMSRSKQVAVAEDIQPDNVSIHAYASPPTFPSEPRVMRTLVKHAMLGGLLGAMLAIGLGWLDRAIHDPERVEALTRLPSLGVIPYMGGAFRNPLRRRGKTPLITGLDSYSREAESFRILRTNLEYTRAGRTPEVVMITSCHAAEGKSTICANLAISFASRGERTLVLDADLKCPRLHDIFKDQSRSPGLTDVLTGQKPVNEVIVPSGVDNLDFLAAGPQSPSPVELLESEQMSELLRELRKSYKRIIIDAAPLHGLSDSLVMGAKVDGVCLVTSLGKTRIDILRRVTTQVAAMRIPVLGIVFNNQFNTKKLAFAKDKYAVGAYGYSYRSSRYHKSASNEV